MATAKTTGNEYTRISSFFSSLAKNDKKEMSILCHDSPDPDCMACALAMKEIGNKYKIKSTIYYGGEINHTQNKAMMNILEIPMIKINDLDDSQIALHKEKIKNSIISLVDTSCFVKGNCRGPLPLISEGQHPEIIIDHHDFEGDIDIPVFINIKTGACASIFTKILKDLKIKIDEKLATALYLGVMKDTDEMNAKDNLTDLDFSSIDFLKPKINLEDYLRIINCPKPKILIDLMGIAKYKYIKQGGNCFVSGVGFIKSPQQALIAEIADNLMSHDQVEKAIVLAIIDDGPGTKKYLVASFRSTGDVLVADEFIKSIFGKNGCGGRKGAAGAKIEMDFTFSNVIEGLETIEQKEQFFKLIYESFANRILTHIEI